MTTVSRLVVSSFASMGKAQLKAVCAYAIESNLLMNDKSFTFKNYNTELSGASGVSIKTIQNIASVAKKISDKLGAAMPSSISGDTIAALINRVSDELAKAAYSSTLDDVNNWLSDKPSQKAQAIAAKAAADAQAKAAAEAQAKAPAAETPAPAAETPAPASVDPFTTIYNELKRLTLTKAQWAQLAELCLDNAGLEANTPLVQLAA